MKGNTIHVYVDKDFVLRHLEQFKKAPVEHHFVSRLLQLRSVTLFTTFTDIDEHLHLKRSLSINLNAEDQLLQKLINRYAIQNGKEVIEGRTNEKLPDFIISSDSTTTTLPGCGIIMYNNQGDFSIQGNIEQRVHLTQGTIKDYITKLCTSIPFHTLRIEDPYLLLNFKKDALREEFIHLFISNPSLRKIDFIYSDYYPKFKNDYPDQNALRDNFEAIKNNLRQAVASLGIKINFYNTAIHDRFFCTNTALYIFGTSITSTQNTHLTYYPLIEYYQEYFH